MTVCVCMQPEWVLTNTVVVVVVVEMKVLYWG